MPTPVVNIEITPASLHQFQRVLKQYGEVRKLDNADAVNRAGMNVAFRAVQFTHRASAADIKAKLLTQVATQTHGFGSKIRRELKKPKPIYAPSTIGKMIFIKKLREGSLYYKGFPGASDPKQFSSKQFASLVMRYINRRISSAAYIAAGFIPIGNQFRNAYRGPRPKGIKLARKRMGIGRAIVARPGSKVVGWLINGSISKDPGSVGALLKYGGQGLERAFAFVTDDMMGYIRKQLEKRAARFNRR